MVSNKENDQSLPNSLHQDSLVLINLLKGKEGKGAKRLRFLIDHPNQAFSPYELYRQMDGSGYFTEPFFEDIPIYDKQYMAEMVQRKNKLLKLEAERKLTEEESFEQKFLNKELANAYGRKNGKAYTAKRENRIKAFKKPEQNRAYAALAMSMLRLFPEGSQAKAALKRHLIFKHGKFSWGKTMD
jgi:hypothetical protein